MFTLNNILGVARSAINAQQMAVQVASNNIANANTEGYTRQRVQMRPGQPIDTALGPAATGVRIAAYERMRDPLLDVSFRRDQGKSAASDMRRDLMREIEGVYGEPSDTGLGATMDAFWSAWEDLAGDPLSDAARGMVRQRAVQLTTGLNNAAEGLETVGANALSRVRDSVTRLNDLGEEVARLNVEIVSAEAGGASANDLRDARDRAIDQMSGLAHVRVTEQANGSASVVVENTLFVDGGDSKRFAVGSAAGGAVRVEIPGSPAIPVSTYGEGSALNEALRVINGDVPAARAELDRLAAALVEKVNDLHTSGYAPGDDFTAPAAAFFTPASGLPGGVVTASSIQVSDEVMASTANIASSGAAGSSTDNTVALGLADLRNVKDAVTLPTGDASFGGAYQDMISGIAQKTRSAEDSSTVFGTLLSQTGTRRASVSGVSVDEELISLMQHQQAYVAATRVVSAVDEMLRDLMGMVR